MQGVCRCQPRFIEILGVAVGGYYLLTRVKGIVHTGDIVTLQKVVCIKNKVSLKRASTVVLLNALKQKLQGKALGFVLIVKALIAFCTLTAHNFGGIIGAVVGNYKYS